MTRHSDVYDYYRMDPEKNKEEEFVKKWLPRTAWLFTDLLIVVAFSYQVVQANGRDDAQDSLIASVQNQQKLTTTAISGNTDSIEALAAAISSLEKAVTTNTNVTRSVLSALVNDKKVKED